MILIGTPAYNGLVHIDYLNSIMSFYNSKIPFSLMTIGNESLITRGRNTIISYYYSKIESFTYLLFLDADIYLDGKDLLKMMNWNKDVIGAPVPMKGKTLEGQPAYNVGDQIKDYGNGLSTTNHIGTAALLLSSKAVKASIEDAKQYKKNPLSRGNKIDIPFYDVFRTEVENEVYLSEDFYLCHKLMEKGFEIFVDTTIETKHNGMYTF